MPDAPPNKIFSATERSPALVNKVYSLLNVDVGYLSAASAAWFSSAGGAPSGCIQVDTAPQSRQVRCGNVRVAFILFPPLPTANATTGVPAALMQQVINAAKNHADADLLVGISPWGFRLEGRALQALQSHIDVVLGAGAGAPFPLDITPFAPGIVWSRSDIEGRQVVELSFFSVPGAQAVRPRAWTRPIDVHAREWRLGQDLPEHAEVATLLTPNV